MVHFSTTRRLQPWLLLCWQNQVANMHCEYLLLTVFHMDVDMGTPAAQSPAEGCSWSRAVWPQSPYCVHELSGMMRPLSC